MLRPDKHSRRAITRLQECGAVVGVRFLYDYRLEEFFFPKVDRIVASRKDELSIVVVVDRGQDPLLEVVLAYCFERLRTFDQHTSALQHETEVRVTAASMEHVAAQALLEDKFQGPIIDVKLLGGVLNKH